MLSDEQVVENLNLSGNFLEASVFASLASSDHFLVTAEWPFSQPAFSGTADIIALNHHVSWDSEPLVIFTIECKKTKKDQKVWVFDSNRTKRDLYQPFVRLSSTGKPIYRERVGYLLPQVGVKTIEDSPIHNKGYELRESDGNLNRNQSERIHKSLAQANEALVGVVRGNYKNIFNVPVHIFENRELMVVPIVVTNASLKTISYDPRKVSKSTGEIASDDVGITENEFIIFDHPLSSELQIPGLMNSEDIQPVKRPTYIVNVENAIKIMEIISDNAEY